MAYNLLENPLPSQPARTMTKFPDHSPFPQDLEDHVETDEPLFVQPTHRRFSPPPKHTHAEEVGPSTGGRAEKKPEIRKDDTKSATMFDEYLIRPPRKLDPTQPMESKPMMVETGEFYKFVRSTPRSKKGEKKHVDQMKYSSTTEIIVALQPQPEWRNKVLRDNRRLQEYLKALSWKQIDPYYMPIK